MTGVAALVGVGIDCPTPLSIPSVSTPCSPLEHSPRGATASVPKLTSLSASAKPEGVGVAVCVRPLSTLERADPSVHNCVQCLKDYVIVTAPPSSSATNNTARPQQFQADRVFHPHCSQIDVYEQSCRHIVEGLFHGINGAILAYGATGSGKTHTMFGSPMSAAGVVYQAVQDIFAEKARLEEEGRRVAVKCSFLEIYNEEVFDLLTNATEGEGGSGSPCGVRAASPKASRGGFSSAGGRAMTPTCAASPNSSMSGGGGGAGEGSGSRQGTSALQGRTAGVHSAFTSPSLYGVMGGGGGGGGGGGAHARKKGRTPLPVRETAKEVRARHPNPESLTVCGLRHVYPKSVDEFAQCIEAGHTNRFVAATGANAQSSRSHAIITVEVSVSSEAEAGSGTVARIRFCDLAGSERAAATSNNGLRLREGGIINRSLLALGAVVQSLVQRKRHPRRQIYVPYRGSKLTRLLRDGIGGNCRTLMLFCLAPSSRQYEESLNTMLFAMQAKEIQVVARRNIYDASAGAVAMNQDQVIEELRAELAAARNALLRLGLSPAAFSSSSTGAGAGPTAATPTMPAAWSASMQTANASSTTATVSTYAPALDGNGNPLALTGASVQSFASVSAVTVSPLISAQVSTVFKPEAVGLAGVGVLPTVMPMARPTYSDDDDVHGMVGGGSGDGGAHASAGAPMSGGLGSLTAAEPGARPPLSISLGTNTNTYAASTPGLLSPAATCPLALPGVPPGSTNAGRLPSSSVGRPTRPSVFHEGSPMLTELESKLKSFTAQKEALYHHMRDAEAQQRDRELKLRELKWKLAGYLANNAMRNRARGIHRGGAEITSGGTLVTPVGVAGLRQMIAALEEESESQDEAMLELSTQLDSVDKQIASARRVLLRERQNTSLELLLDNARLRQSCTEAECLAAHYHQECRTVRNRVQEYDQALQTCVTALRASLPLLPYRTVQLEQAKMALLFAGLPTARTEDILEVFEGLLRLEATPPLAPQSRSSSPPLMPTGAGTGMGAAVAVGVSANGHGGALPPMAPIPGLRLRSSTTVDDDDVHTSNGGDGEREGERAGMFSTPPPSSLGLPTTSAAAANTATPTSSTGLDLEQHYRELVEAASCFKCVSPIGVRGRRNRTPTRTRDTLIAEGEASVSDRESESERAGRRSGSDGVPTTAAAATAGVAEPANVGMATVDPREADPLVARRSAGRDALQGLPTRSDSARLAPSKKAAVAATTPAPKPFPYARTFSTSSLSNAREETRAPATGVRRRSKKTDGRVVPASRGVVGRAHGGGGGMSSSSSSRPAASVSHTGAAQAFGRANSLPVMPTSSSSSNGGGGGNPSLAAPANARPRAHSPPGTSRHFPTTTTAVATGVTSPKRVRVASTCTRPAQVRVGRPSRVGSGSAATVATAMTGTGTSTITPAAAAAVARRQAAEEAMFQPTITQLPRGQRPQFLVRGNTASELRAIQAAGAGAGAGLTSASTPSVAGPPAEVKQKTTSGKRVRKTASVAGPTTRSGKSSVSSPTVTSAVRSSGSGGSGGGAAAEGVSDGTRPSHATVWNPVDCTSKSPSASASASATWCASTNGSAATTARTGQSTTSITPSSSAAAVAAADDGDRPQTRATDAPTVDPTSHPSAHSSDKENSPVTSRAAPALSFAAITADSDGAGVGGAYGGLETASVAAAGAFTARSTGISSWASTPATTRTRRGAPRKVSVVSSITAASMDEDPLLVSHSTCAGSATGGD